MIAARRKLLFIAPTMPLQGGNGLAMRAAALLEALALRFAVTLYVVPVAGGSTQVPAFVADLTDRVGVLGLASGLESQAALIGRVRDPAERRRHLLAYPRPWATRYSGAAASRALAAWVGETNFDVLHVMRLYLAPLGLRFLNESNAPAPPALLDLDEDDACVQVQLACLHERLGETALAEVARAEAGKFARLAQESLPGFATVLTCADHGSSNLAQRYPGTRFATVPNTYPASAVPSRSGHPDRRPAGPLRLLFVGNFGYLPNRDAAAHLVHDILPRLREGAADVEVDIVGTGGTHAMLGAPAAGAGVAVHGAVADLSRWYDRTDLAVVPLRAGGGTRIKILEAFAHRVPVVSTRIGAAGLDVVHGRDLLLADAPADFARACLQLHHEPDMRARLAANGASLLQECYSPACIRTALDAIVKEFEY